ncbi:MAG: hypothetical protein H6843_11725 [Rhodospirillaceae bacterium]|nr:hypothetical protein [Rhodospirillaceae bacterium]
MQQTWRAVALAMALAWSGSAAAQQGPVERIIEQLGSFSALPDASICETVGDITTERQLIRLHTELLLTSLACSEAYGFGEGELFVLYRQFTADHAREIIHAQNRIEAEFGGGVGGVVEFDAFRTAQANDEAQMLNDMGAGAYCAMRHARFDSLTGPNAVSFEGYAEALAMRARSAAPRC